MKFAITGSIGSGKSTICKLFNNLGVNTFNSDEYIKELCLIPSIKAQIVDIIGDCVLSYDNIDLKKLSTSCFYNPLLRNKVYNTISDELFEIYYDFCERSNSPYTIFESSLIFNYNKQIEFDKIIGVVANDDIKIKRIIDRSNCTQDEAIYKINTQLSNFEIVKRCDFIIQNNHDLKRLSGQVKYVHNIIIGNIKTKY